jgi:glycosyltransferase involved in cell wall biosynthesis
MPLGKKESTRTSKNSFIVTIYNEEKTIIKFLESLINQTKMPDEIIIVDGGSTDATAEIIAKFSKTIPSKIKKAQIKFFTKKGNRSVGRNEAIKQAKGEIIICSDSGNILDKSWVKNIIEPFNKNVDVVAGYYKGLANNNFQKSLIPYVLVMEDKVDSKQFLPATRSIAFTKAIWNKVGKFDERLSHNEDYVFAKKLKELGANIVFAKNAIVYWIPRSTVKQAFIMFCRFAIGDAESGIFRTSVLLVLARYFLAIYFIFLSILYQSKLIFAILFFGFILYLLWSVKKNYRYVKDKSAFFYLPLFQLTADMAVIIGTSIGILKLFIQHFKT